jgi:hypothetical protein
MEPYAPYPLDLVRDWLRRRRWWVRLAVALVVVGWGGYWAQDVMRVPEDSPPWAVAGANPWTMPIPYAVYAYPIDPARTGRRICWRPFGDLPTLPVIDWPPPVPEGMRWEPEGEYAEGQVEAAVATTGPPSATLTIDVSIALGGDWRPAERLHRARRSSTSNTRRRSR